MTHRVNPSEEAWLHLYRTMKLDIDPYLSEHPRALNNILNLKKMVRVDRFQTVMQELLGLDRFGPPAQQVGATTSRKTLLIRLRAWLREPYHLVRAPVFPVPTSFTAEAVQYFQNPARAKDVFYRLFAHRGHDYHFFVFKTGTVHSRIEGYSAHRIYLMGIVDHTTIEVVLIG